MSHLHGTIPDKVKDICIVGDVGARQVVFRGAQARRVRLNVASATSTFAGCVSQFGSTIGAMLVSVLVTVTLLCERGATRAAATEP